MATAAIGHNQPPTPYDALQAHIDDLDLEARNHLDCKPIETETQAEAVAKLLDDARKASKAADDQRKIEVKPFNDGKAAVQALYNPLIARADLVADTAKAAQTAWLIKREDEKRAAVEAATVEAERLAAAARTAAEQAAPGDLAGATTVRVLQESAAAAVKGAEGLSKQRVSVAGGSRANSLRSGWITTLSDPLAFGKWAWEHRNAEYLEFLTTMATREGRNGPREIPGLTITEERKAV